MRAVVQRVREASVEIGGKLHAQIGRGMLLLLGVEREDGAADVEYLTRKIAALRIFADAAGKMNLAVGEIGGEVLVVSQFTLCADVRRGNRPGFDSAMPPEPAARMVENFVAALAAQVPHPPQTGMFGADMQVRLINDGPVTIVMESRARVGG